MAAAGPSEDDIVQSLASAADAARQVYLAAHAQNPSADLSALYQREMQAAALWSEAEDKALTGDSKVTAAKAALDAATQNMRNNLANLKDIAQCLDALDNLVKLATSVSAFLS